MNHSLFTHYSGPLLALASAALFGASTPVSKLLLGVTDPLLLAGLLYLGSGIGLGIIALGARLSGRAAEAPLRRRDLPWLGLIILFGGVLGPALLMAGLTFASASAGSLLLNTESLATMVIAWIFFRENVDRRLFAGAMAILAGALVLSWPADGAAITVGRGGALIVAACICWGIDNNLTRKLSAANPVQLAMVKGVAAGIINTALGFAHGAQLPYEGTLAAAAIVGFLGYGVSLALFVLGLRHLGAARTGAYFSTAPFIGAVIAVPLFAEPVTWLLIAAAALMAAGVYLHLAEKHEHEHVHEPLVHEHRHVHDAHHQHVHAPSDPDGEPHSHPHQHGGLVHKHPHYPDLHHRHEHA
jgi:drug/metabolite transporter (DMT)-like permease